MRFSKPAPQVIALLSLIVAVSAEAAPPSSVQDVRVTNTPLPVTIDDVEIDVFVANESLAVDVQGPVEVTGTAGNPVVVTSADALIPWSHSNAIEFPDSDGVSSCLNSTNPPGYLFVVEQVSAQLLTRSAAARLRIVSRYETIDGVHDTDRFFIDLRRADPIVVSPFQEHFANEAVTIYATDLCVLAEVSSATTSSHLDYTLSGHLVPVP